MTQKNKPFFLLFTIYYVVITIVTVVTIILIGLNMTDKFFSYYVNKAHEENQRMILMKFSVHYMLHGTWDGYNMAEMGDLSKIAGDYFTFKDANGSVLYSSESEVGKYRSNINNVYTSQEFPIVVDDNTVATVSLGYFSNHIESTEEDAFRKSGILLIVLSVIGISLTGALISILFFYRLSKPINAIATLSKDISKGYLRSRIVINSNVQEMNQIANSINFLGESLLNQQKFRQNLTVELSHELRTPLQILLNQVEAIIDKIYVADDERMQVMHIEINRIIELLDELEDRMFFESESLDLDIQMTNLSDVVRRIAIGYEGGFAKKRLHFSHNVESDIMLDVDKMKFSQMLINLLSNSLKYTHEGSVNLLLYREAEAIYLRVVDTGVGIGADKLKDIFNGTSSHVKTKNGRGIGLYIAKLIADKHGWEITLDSTPDKGTTVTVGLK